MRANFSANDAIYVALAEALGATLAADAKLGRAVKAHLGLDVIAP